MTELPTRIWHAPRGVGGRMVALPAQARSSSFHVGKQAGAPSRSIHRPRDANSRCYGHAKRRSPRRRDFIVGSFPSYSQPRFRDVTGENFLFPHRYTFRLFAVIPGFSYLYLNRYNLFLNKRYFINCQQPSEVRRSPVWNTQRLFLQRTSVELFCRRQEEKKTTISYIVSGI